MMLAQLVVEASRQGVLLYEQDGQLKYKLKVDHFPEQIKSEIQQNKTELISFLRKRKLNQRKATIPVFENKDLNRVPLTPSQQGIWLAQQLSPDSNKYVMSFELAVEGEFDANIAERAFNEIISRHEVLRANFYVDNGVPFQRIHSDVAFALEREQVGEAQGLDDPVLHQHASAFRGLPFDLTHDILIRAKHLEIGPNKGLLLFGVHHLIADGWSISVIMKEFIAHYKSIALSRHCDLPELSVQFSDVCLWQQQKAESSEYQDGLDYWQQRLDGIPPVSSLPLDNARQGKRVGGQLTQQLAPDLVQRMKQYCAKHDTTLFILLKTLFALHLGRVTRETDVVIGAPDSGRSHEQAQSMIGLFLQTRVMRTQFDDNPSFSELLQRSKEYFIADSKYLDIPFETLVAQVNPTRERFISPVFQVLINFDAMLPFNDGLDNVTFQSVEGHELENKFDLTLYFSESEQGALDVCWVYDAAIFDAESIRTNQSEFIHLITNCIEHETRPVLSHPWSSPYVVTPKKSLQQPPSVVELFLQQVAKVPNHVALRSDEACYTYTQLNTLVNKACSVLEQSYNISRGHRVAIATSRDEYRIVYMLAILKLSCTYIPISEELPRNRVEFILKDAEADLVIVDDQIWSQFELTCYNVKQSKFLAELTLAEDKEPAIEHREGDDIAHIIYTSGSTGQPKGVLGTFQATANRIQWMISKWPFSADEVTAHITSCAFIRGIWEVLTPLCAGSTLTLFKRSVVKDVNAFAEQLSARNVSRIVTAPSLVNGILHLSDTVRSQINDTLKYWFVSGEPFPVQLASKALNQMPAVEFYNLYGSTEVMSDVMWSKVAVSASQSRLPIGEVIEHVGAYIADTNANPVAPGAIGEIVITGAALARGYTQNATGGFSSSLQGPVYHTGDLGRVDLQGRFECFGRQDDQIKIRGYRVELGEILSHLLKVSEVKSAAVIPLINDDSDASRIIAYVVSPTFDEQRIKQALLKELPHYFVPSTIVSVDAIPTKENGKVDKQALLALGVVSNVTEIVPPETDSETKLNEIWAALLQVDASSISVTSSFFEAGGNSLLASRLVAVINDEFNVNLSLKQLFEFPTIREGAGLLEDLEALQTEQNNQLESTEYEEFSL
ncbi:condensation domain-containing protein [Pseudoalteromonas umbrosa]|uniref:non-ribosomal peptide synthetase n=1 Tax=Pseudoalteromonas umbrosa TaxID=3048489 RepID=UPI0024C29BDE|nr:condensation domain-containing protein [Pseudoalteromonas sp. B95]MDK1288850.1 condensation domain-containing protein [Pseudoalteromonas sp. B95]